MKKHLKTLLLAIPCTFFLTACNLGDIISGLISEDDTSENEDDSYDSDTSAGGNSGTSNGGGDSGSVTFADVETILERLGSTFSFSFESKASANNEEDEYFYSNFVTNGEYVRFSYGEDKDDLYSYFLRQQEDIYVGYMDTTEDGQYDYAAAGDSSLESEINSVTFLLALTSGNMTPDTTTSVTYLNKPCTKYTKTVDAGITGGSSYAEYVIDNEIGMLMSSVTSATVSYGGTTLTRRTETKITAFTQNATTINNDLKTDINKIVIKDWDAEAFASFGISGVNKPNGKWCGGSINEYKYETCFYLAGSSEENFAATKGLIQSFYSAGANKDYDGNSTSSYTQTGYEEDDELIMWYGYLTHNGEQVTVSIRAGEDYSGVFSVYVSLSY